MTGQEAAAINKSNEERICSQYEDGALYDSQKAVDMSPKCKHARNRLATTERGLEMSEAELVGA